jgi:hypothetical protein
MQAQDGILVQKMAKQTKSQQRAQASYYSFEISVEFKGQG